MDTQLITTTVSAITLVTEIFNVAKEFSTPYRKWKIRAKIKDELYEQEYRKSINANISKVAENNLQVPNPSIVFTDLVLFILIIHLLVFEVGLFQPPYIHTLLCTLYILEADLAYH